MRRDLSGSGNVHVDAYSSSMISRRDCLTRSGGPRSERTGPSMHGTPSDATGQDMNRATPGIQHCAKCSLTLAFIRSNCFGAKIWRLKPRGSADGACADGGVTGAAQELVAFACSAGRSIVDARGFNERFCFFKKRLHKSLAPGPPRDVGPRGFFVLPDLATPCRAR